MKTNHLITAAVGLGIAAVAYTIGSRNQSHPGAAPAEQATAQTSLDQRSLREILNDPNPITFQKGYLDYLGNLRAEEAYDAATLLWSTAGELADVKERQKLFSYAWGALDGEASVEFIMANQSVAKVPALAQAMAGWASKDPQSARTWIEGRMKPAERLLYNWALVDGWSRHDPDGATDYVLSLKSLPGTDRFVRSIALEQVRRDPTAATAWVAELPAGSLQNTAVEEIALRWSQVDPAAATDWAATVPNRGVMKRAVGIALTEWSQRDSISAGEYLTDMPVSSARDHAIAAHVGVLASENLESISGWANHITDTALRERSLLQIADEWSDRDREGMLAWLPESGLSQNSIEEILGRSARR